MVAGRINAVHKDATGSGGRWRGQLRRSIYFILFLSLLFLTSCGQGPRVRSINKASDGLYLVMEDWTIRVYDVSRRQWRKSVEISGKASFRGRYPAVNHVLMDRESFFIQIGTSVNNSYEESDLFVLKEGEVKKLGRLPYHTELLAVDQQFLYFAQIKSAQTKPKETPFHVIPFRYDKQMKERKEFHFEGHPDLVAADICQSGGRYWYACINGAVGQNIHVGGPLVLLSRPNQVDPFERFNLPEYGVQLENVTLSSDEEFLWVLEKASYGRHKVPRFKKAAKEFVVLEMKDSHCSISGPYRLLAERDTMERGGSFWLICGKDLFRLDKETFEIERIPLPHEINLHNNYPLRPVFSDDKSLWITLVTSRENIGPGPEVLLRISKADLNRELIPIDRAAMIRHSMLNAAVSIWPVYIILGVALLVLGAVLGLVNTQVMKDMKGKKMTAWCSIASILIIACSPWYKDRFDSFFIPVLLLIGVTTILLSRSLSYLVKQMRYPLVSWILTLMFSAGSGLLFLILFGLAFRSVGGERAIGLSLVMCAAAIGVGVIAVVVNVTERIIRS